MDAKNLRWIVAISIALVLCVTGYFIKRKDFGIANHGIDAGREEFSERQDDGSVQQGTDGTGSAGKNGGTFSKQEGSTQPISENSAPASAGAVSNGVTGKDSMNEPLARNETDAIKEKPAACTLREFQHEDLASHRDGKMCLDHKNTISLGKLHAKPVQVCVRVNDRVVKSQFAKKADEYEVSFGSEAGPKALVKIETCFEKSKCGPCKVTADRFLSSLGVDDAEAGAGDDKVEKEYQKLQNALGNDSKELASDFRGWKLKTESQCNQ